MEIENTSPLVKNFFRHIKAGKVEDARGMVRGLPALMHARTGSSQTDTPLLVALLARNKDMVRMLLDEGSPIFSIGKERGRIPLEIVLRGGLTGMLEVFVEHFGSINALVERSREEGKLSWMMGILADGAMPTKLHEQILLVAIKSDKKTDWPSGSDFACIRWPWSDSFRWADPSDDFIQGLEAITIGFPDTPQKMQDIVLGPYSAEESWLNTMANLVNSRANKFSSRWLACTPDELWIKPMPGRPSRRGVQPAFAETLLEWCAIRGYVPGMKLGLEALTRIESGTWIEENRARLFKAACGVSNAGNYPSISSIRLLDASLGIDGLKASDRKSIVERLILIDYEPRLRAKAVRMFIDGPDTLPSTESLLKITSWSPKTSKSMASIVVALSENGLDPGQVVRGSLNLLDILMQSHPEAAALISSSMLHRTPIPAHEAAPRPRM